MFFYFKLLAGDSARSAVRGGCVEVLEKASNKENCRRTGQRASLIFSETEQEKVVNKHRCSTNIQLSISKFREIDSESVCV